MVCFSSLRYPSCSFPLRPLYHLPNIQPEPRSLQNCLFNVIHGSGSLVHFLCPSRKTPALPHMNLNARCQSHHPCLLTASGTLFTDHSQCLSRLPHPHLPVGILHISHIAPYISTPLFWQECLAHFSWPQSKLISHPPFPLKLICFTPNRGNCFHLDSCNILSLTALYLFCFTIASFVFEYLS